MVAENPTVNRWKDDFNRRPSPGFSEPGEGSSFEELDASAQMNAAPPSSSGKELWEPLMRHLAELRDSLRLYVALRVDQWRAAGRNLVIYAVLLAVASIIAISTLITASVLFVTGLATGLGELFGGRIWAGQLILGAGFIAIACGIPVVAARFLRFREHERLITKYETQLQRECGSEPVGVD